MFRYFRKIRNALVKEGKMRSYGMYAFGEIVLVVIGILIALQINNLNQNRQDREKELTILKSLLDDFFENNQNLEIALERYEQRNYVIETSLNYIGIKDHEITESVRRYLSSTGYYPTKVIDGTLSSVLSSEKLELLTNDSLKSFLTSYPSEIKAFKDQENNVKRIVIDLQRPIYSKYLSLTNFIIDDTLKFPDLQKKAPISKFSDLINDMEYQNALIDQYYQMNLLARQAQKLKDLTEKIIQIIQGQMFSLDN